MPLSSLAPNRKGTNEYNANGRPSYSRIEELGQLEGGMSRSGSEPDSLLDLYRHNASNGNVSTHNADTDIPENMYKMPDQEDPEGWIHRDKLAKIESEELQAAGINLANARRTYSKSSRRTSSRERKNEDDLDRRESKKPRVSEPALEEEEDGHDDWDLRTPEEIAAEQNASSIYAQPVLRKSGSRIPVLTSSPNPIPSERLDRDTPLPRKRTMSNSMSPDGSVIVQKTRKGSSAEPSTPIPADDPPSKSSSPTKQRAKSAQTPSKATTPAARKPSAPPKTNQTPQTPASPPRPGTRGGDPDRPRTAVNRPEGDPPWLATMYKPDPRLPPDQQIIPTHARKQQQAQWIDEGAVPKTYDRDFTPIAVHNPDVAAKRLSFTPTSPTPVKDEAERKPDEQNTWPLKPMSSVRSNNGRPGTSGSMTGGYSTMPKVASPPIIQSPRMGSTSSTKPGPPARLQAQQMPLDEKDDGTVKKGCGCCVVM